MSKLDIITIRDQLNAATFEHGKRRVCIGLVAELFAGLSELTVSEQLAELERELESHGLTLLRGGESDELYVEQTLRREPDDPAWMRDALQWTSRITTVTLEMALPGVLGTWADQRLNTNYLGFLGLLIGVPLGIWHLLRMTRREIDS